MTLGLLGLGVALVLLVAHLQLGLFLPVPRRALRVLMYHRVSGGEARRDAVPAAELEWQVGRLRETGHTLVSLREVVAHVAAGAPLPERAVLLTFDDGTLDAHQVLAPLLARLAAPAALFVVPGLAGQERAYDGRPVRYLSAAQLRDLAAAGIGLGLHTFEHVDLRTLPPAEVEADVRRCVAWLEAERIPFERALAFPYGAYPRRDPAARQAFLAALRRAGLTAAFRIGNRVNPLPLARPLEIQRTEVRGDEPRWVFERKVRAGRLRAFA